VGGRDDTRRGGAAMASVTPSGVALGAAASPEQVRTRPTELNGAY
jgi:hypothetical protein